ncbi:MAG: serine hydrolase domain-containing protein [Pirellula sp.]
MFHHLFLVFNHCLVITAFFVDAMICSNTHAQEQAFLEALQPYVDRQELAGAVMLVANGKQTLHAQAIGWADRDQKQPMRIDSLFWIASQSKPMTAATLMILVDEKRVSLDDPVKKFLPEFAGAMVTVESDSDHKLLRKPNETMTVRHLLSHTSGLPFKSSIEEPTLDLYPLTARVKSYAMTPLESEPGEKYLYSNAGINTAARIVEVVSGKSFEEFLDERLFRPLGMNNTTFWPNEQQAANIAKSYKPTADKQGIEATVITQLRYPLTDRLNRYPMPAGGLFSTASDVARFYQMLLNQGELDGKRILTKESSEELTKRQTSSSLKESYGLGFNVSPNTFGHGGAYSTNTVADRQRGLIFVWLVQHAGFKGDGSKAQEVFRTLATKTFEQ